MITRINRNELGILMTMGVALGLPMQEFVRVPNDRTGVGASGKIGRGTSSGEQFVPRSMPVQLLPARNDTTTMMPVQPPSVAINVNSSNSADRAEIRGVDLAADLPALARRNPYLAYHRGWVHGYWNARLPGSWSRPTAGYAGMEAASWKGPRPGLGTGLGWGLPAWLIGPMAYTWGYFPYDNPFHRGGPSSGVDPARAGDYSRPIDVVSPPPTETLLNDALESFRAARDAFRREDYPRALQLTGESLRLMPDDPMLHQFRALILFALRRYDDAAATLYAVLADGPGWDWTTMISCYGNRETYTRQLRLLEGYSDENPRAAARFVRAYHYLTTGYAEDAIGQWEHVVALQPNDRLSTQLIRELRPYRQGNGDRVARPPTTSGATSAASSSGPGKLEGTWTAHPRSATIISLTFQDRGHLVWKVSQPGRDREFEGYAFYEKTTLTLSQNQDNALVGTVDWQDDRHFTFKVLADRSGDAGLAFAKSP